jgi:hypothetical protein
MISGRTIALFIHLMGVITLFIAMAMTQRVGARMRAASTIGELRLWLSLAKTTGAMWPSAFALILLSGLYMTTTLWSFETPWIVTGIATLVVMGAVGGGLIGRSFASIGRKAASAHGVTAELRREVCRPALWIAASALNGLALAVLWLMVNKPGWGQSLGVVAALGVAGAAAGVIVSRKAVGVRSPAVSS